MQHVHEDFIKKHNVDVSSLSAEIQSSITEYNNAKINFDLIDDPSEVKILKDKLQKASNGIKDEIKEHIDNELMIDVPVKEQKDQVLSSLFENGRTLVSKSELMAAGYDCSKLTRRGENLDKFKLFKSSIETKYKIVKK